MWCILILVILIVLYLFSSPRSNFRVESDKFDLVYDEDMGEPIGDGFYFTVSRQGMTGAELLFQMLRYGMAGIPLSTTGSTKEGIRICVSIIRESQLGEMENRLSALNHHLQPNPA